jgi:pre-mRNA-splicing factor ATP-dependent RNA helicase DHX38/PRP16
VLPQGQKTGGAGASEFARTKTLAEQREYLPVRQVRDDLMRVISDHQVR